MDRLSDLAQDVRVATENYVTIVRDICRSQGEDEDTVRAMNSACLANSRDLVEQVENYIKVLVLSSTTDEIEKGLQLVQACIVVLADSLDKAFAMCERVVRRKTDLENLDNMKMMIGQKLLAIDAEVKKHAEVCAGKIQAKKGGSFFLKRVVPSIAVGALAVIGAPVVLGVAGFGAGGIVAGSLAAKMMSAAAIANGGGVAAGSLVAMLQSAGAAGIAASTFATIFGTAAGATAVVGEAVSRLKKKLQN